jgi:tetratricopeptide (TPR) repeat protein
VNRSILPVSFVVALALAVIPSAALAQNATPPPTPAQIEKAKKAFQEGKKLHEQKKLPEAIAKFKESYDLSKNPLLLYNIGFTMDEALMEDLALYYYRKFLADAPADAAQRGEVEARVKVLEAKFNPGVTTPDPNATKPDPNATKPDPGPKKPLVIKPPGTYSATDFQHEVVDVAPPAKPLDITAFVPEDSGFVVTLYYRTAGEGKFASKEMRWRYKELVGRVPAPKMIGDSVQYYIEAKDATGAVIAKSGKSTSPNLVTLEANAPQRFYPDFSEEGESKITEADIKARDDEDDPLNRNKKKQTAQPIGPIGDDSIGPVDNGQPGHGFRDVGSSKFKYVKWGSTIGAAAFIGLGAFGFYTAGNYATQLEDDYTLCGAPPCKPYDSVAKDWESTGKRWQTIANVSFVVGGVATLVAGYYWYKELTAKKRGELKVSKAGGSPETTWVVLPQIDADGQTNFIGGTAAARF